jgi:hypothetical protein
MSEDSYEAAGKLAALFPKAIFVTPEDRRPLKVGIRSPARGPHGHTALVFRLQCRLLKGVIAVY